MKKTIPSSVIRFLTLIFLGFGIIGISNQAIAQDNATEVETEILGYWNQNSNDLPGGGFGFLADPDVFPQTADIGNATLSVGGGFLDTSVNASGDLIYTWLPSFAGTTANAQNDDPNGGSISMQGGTLVEGVPANNGSYLQFAVPMSGYENLNISYATRGTATGFNTQTWSWSTDGTNFTNFATVTGTNVTTFFVAEATAPAALNGVETAYLRVVFDGATTLTGNNRMDNILFTATPTGSSAVPPPAPVGFVMNTGAGNGQIFFAAGPNQVGGNIVYRLFYSLTSEVPGNPTTATEYIFGSTAGDGNGISPFGFTLSGLEPGASYTSWLYQYDTTTGLFSAPDQAQATAGNTGGGGDDAPTVAAPTPTEDAANVISLFSNAYTNINGVNLNPGWGQSTQVEIIEIEGNTTLKYSNFNYQGTEFPTLDVSNMTTVHIDMWTANATSVNFTIISPGPQEKLFALPITAGAWVSYEIPLSYFNNVNLSEIFQLKFDGGNGSQTIFLDNIYFSGGDDPVTDGPNAPIDFEEGGFGADWTWNMFGNGPNTGLEIIDNPDQSGINTSARVAKFTALSQANGGANFAGVESTHGADLGSFVLDASNAIIKIMVWKANISDVGIKLAAPTGWAQPEIKVGNTLVNQWEELTFDFSGVPNPPESEGMYDQIIIFPDFVEGNRPEDTIIYFDNITFNEVSGGIPPPAPVGFVMNPGAGDGQIFFAAGPNQVGGDIVYRLFYSLTSEVPGNPTTATEYIFGSTPGDGDGVNAFGFTLSGLQAGASYTSWLYQYDTSTQLFSAPAQGQATAGGTGGGGDDAPTVAAPTPTEDAANVISLFSNAYTNIDGVNLNPGWGQSTQVEIIEIEGNTTLKYSNFNYQGTEFPTLDVSNMTTVHIDMWTANATSVNFTIISPGPQEKLFALPITAGEWVSYEIPLSYFDNVNLSEIFQLKFDGGNGSQTIFLDNIYFSGEEIVDPVIEVGSIAELYEVAVPGDGAVYTLTNEVYLVFTSNFRGRKVVVDGTGGVLIDDPGAGVLSKEYNRYAGITGLTFQVALFGDTIQLIPVADAGEATSENNLVLPRRAFIPELGVADQSNLVIIENVTFVQQGDFANQTTYTIVDGDGNQMSVRTDRIAESILMDDEETYIGTPIPSDAVSLIGYISIFQGNPQLVIRKLDDIADASAVGAFSLVSPPNNAEVPLVAGSDNLVSIDWTTASGDDVEYLWFANASGLPLMVPAVAVFAEDSGFSISEGELVDIIESLFGEVNSGDTFTLDWAVFAFSNNGARHSDQVWTVTFVIAEEAIGENVTFSINMSYQEDLGVFQPEVGDLVFVRGSFNGWSTVDGQELVETTPGIFEVTLFIEGEEGTEHAYKYYIMAGDGRTLPNTGWEVNNVGPVGDNGDRLLVLVGEDQVLDTVWFNNEEGTSTGNEMDLPMEFALKQNYPNPFNPTTQIQYALPQASEVRIDVFNVMGQRVATLVNGAQNAGFHTVTFDANRLASGVYIYRMQAGSFVQTQKMLLVK